MGFGRIHYFQYPEILHCYCFQITMGWVTTLQNCYYARPVYNFDLKCSWKRQHIFIWTLVLNKDAF